MNFLVCFPIAAYVLLFAAFCTHGAEWRAAAIHAAVVWGAAVAAVMEILSVFHCLAVPGLVLAWMLVDAAAAIYLYRGIRVHSPRPEARTLFAAPLRAISGSDGSAAAFLTGAGLIVVLVGLIALCCPPNTQDSMTYHLPRIVYWLHNRSVAFYPTQNIRQLGLQPWAEYAMTQWHALSGGDRFDNLVQWLSMLGSVIGVSVLAQLLGATRRGQALAALMCATIPEAILEASAAKNDYVLAFWLVAMTYYLFALRQDCTVGNALGFGGSLGLACLTKGTAYVFAPPIVAAVLLVWPWKKPGRYARCLLWAGAIALILNAGVFARNYRLFGSPFGPVSYGWHNDFKVTNDRLGIGVTVSNVIRNLALHAGTPVPILNARLEGGIKRLLGYLGQDINDPRTTWSYTAFHVPMPSRHEALAGNPLHGAVILATILCLISRRRAAAFRSAFLLAVGLVVAFGLFCALLKWQPWNTRLHLPLFVLWSPVAATVLGRSWPRFATAAVGMLLLFTANPFVMDNELRPLAGAFNILNQPRTALYFADRRDLLTSYTAAARFVETLHCDDVGLDMSAEPFEYPLLVLLHDQTGARRVRHINVGNPSKIYAGSGDSAVPCALICPNCPGHNPSWSSLSTQYKSVKVFDTVAVLGSGEGGGDACSVAFTGWYPRESDGKIWWRWSAGNGQLHIAVSQSMEATLEGALSSIVQPNTVNILANGGNEALIQIASTTQSSALSLPLHLKEGDNLVEFISRRAGIRIPTDDRILSISVRDLRIRTVPGIACPIEP
ncbi:MAG: glycosyltransferase family 39 protein [Acidobacteriia bacterium]|nr:glycosyltransferase family 39 protein [Terriglobia bacterium]